MKERKCYYPHCTRGYSSKYNLARHVNTFHLQIRKHYCDRCSRVFPSKQNLAIHQKASTCSLGKATKKINQKQVEFLLSDHYKETTESVGFSQTSVLIPHLPTVDLERRRVQEELKLPTLPILIHPIKQ